MRGVWVFLACVWTVECFPNGQVSGSCGSMLPSHGANALTTTAPYSISVDKTSYKDGDELTVTLSGNSGTTFKGFLLEARMNGGSSPVGYFTSPGSNAQSLACSGQSNAAVSHTSSNSKTQIQSKWKASTSGNTNYIEFRATVVKDYSNFWTGVKSAQVAYSGSTTQSTQSPGSTSNGISSSGCGSSKTCLSSPASCDPSTDSSCYFTSITPLGSASQYKIEISGQTTGYVAIGFSDDKNMGNDDIYICGKDSSGNIQLQHAFSTGTTTPTTIALGNVSDITKSVTNGVISCSFTSQNSISTTRASQNTYYLFLANGPSTNGVIQVHSSTPLISASKVDITTPQLQTAAEAYPPIIKAHGCLMLISWMTTGSIGMILARYFKKAAKGQRFCGKDFWFVAHLFLMLLSVAATIIAFILVFSSAQDWSGGAHPVLGCLVMILSLAQPIAAMFRCGPQDERRYIFNWAHSINALAIKGLAVAAIFTGLMLVDSSDAQWLPKVMGGFVAWEALLFLGLDIHQKRSDNVGAEHDSGRTSTQTIILFIFLFGNLAFLISLLVGIGKA